jgi:hypothetical protein
MRIKTRAALIFSLLLMPGIASAWGPLGHRVVAKMAQGRLTPEAESAVRSLLGPGATLAEVSAWADEQREEQGSELWHFVNVPIAQARYSPKYCSPRGCVVSKTEEFSRVLRDPSARKPDKRRALKFLIHFIADLHHPLHVGDNNDRGGNRLQVTFFGTGSNLHKVWDSQIMARHTTNEQVWLWDFNYLANPRMAAEWSKGAPADWATESLEIARTAYCLPGSGQPMKSGTRLGNDYYRIALTLVQKQLAKAGIRTAWTLNEIFR